MLRKIDFSGYARRCAERLGLSERHVQLALRLRLNAGGVAAGYFFNRYRKGQAFPHSRAAQPQFCVTSVNNLNGAPHRFSPLRFLSFALLLTLLFSTHAARAQNVDEPTSGARSSDTNPPLELLEIGDATVRPSNVSTTAPAEIRIVSYNIHYRGGEDLQRLIELFRSDMEIGGAQIIGLQEVDRNTRRVGGANTARVMAEALGMHYAWAAPPRTPPRQPEDETGVTILSSYPLTNVERLVLPNAGPGGRRRVAVGATLLLPEGVRVRVYSLHGETRAPHAEKMEQYRAVLDHAARTSANGERIIILGDFNTIKGRSVRDTRRMFTEAGFSTPFPDNQTTWRFYLLRLKLDWLWLRGFGEVRESGIARRIELSDHWPLWVRVAMR